MSSPTDRDDVGALLAAHANGELGAEDRQRLRAMADVDAELRAEVESFDALHEAFALERELQREVLSGDEPLDPQFRTLLEAGARAEADIRQQVFAPTAASGGWGRDRVALWVAAAALIVSAIALWTNGGTQRPPLVQHAPGGSVLGNVARIVMTPDLGSADPSVSWQAVLGASRYDARIEHADGHVVLRRSDRQARSTLWELTPEQFDRLRAVEGTLRLRVEGFDSMGTLVATSGDLHLRLGD